MATRKVPEETPGADTASGSEEAIDDDFSFSSSLAEKPKTAVAYARVLRERAHKRLRGQ